MRARRPTRAGLLALALGVIAAFVFILTVDAKATTKVHRLQHAAVSQCGKGRGKLVNQNVVVRRGRVHHLAKGHRFVSHRAGACAPKRQLRLASAITSGQLGCDLSNNDPIYSGFYSIRSKGLTYCWLKDIEGVGFHDRTASPMRYWADKAGVTVGGYDFAHVCLVSAGVEAHFFAAELKADGLTGTNRLFPALDAEYGGAGCSTAAWVNAWIAQMHNEGYPSVTIYTGCWWWQPHVGNWWPSQSIAAWISGYPSARPCGHAVTVHQFTDHGNLGGGYGDENVLLGQPGEIAGQVEVIPPEVKRLQDQIAYFWDHRPVQDKRTYDSDMNRIYFLGWQPHRSGPSHDWAFKPGAREQWICTEVQKHWAKNRHGRYVRRLLDEAWSRSHTRVHLYGCVRMPGFYRVAG